MFESKILNVPELAARWGKSTRQILDDAANLRLHLLFDFDGLVIDAKGDKLARFYYNQEREHEGLSKFVKSAEAKFQRRIHGQLSQFESLTDSEAGELRKQVTDAEAKIQIFKELSDIVTRERLKYHYRGQLVATPETVDELKRLGFAKHPIHAYSLNGEMVRLEVAKAQWKERLEPADMVVSMADVKAIEAAGGKPAKAGAVENVEIDFTILATRQQLIDAFGSFTGMDNTWFDNLTDAPKLEAARKVKGQGGKHSTEPLFCPYEVMQWLVDPKRKKWGRTLSDSTAWRLLKKNFEKVYNQHSIGDPNAD